MYFIKNVKVVKRTNDHVYSNAFGGYSKNSQFLKLNGVMTLQGININIQTSHLITLVDMESIGQILLVA